jgi:hypothetical protein
MDIVIDDVAKEWHGRSRFVTAGATVQVHMEVAAYAAWDEKKVTDDLNLLHRSIDEASAAGRRPWTSLVLVGGEWKDAKENIAEFLHDYYHERWSRPRHSAPPFVDAVVVPGMYLMKHWMFEELRHLPPSNTAGIASWEVVWATMMEHPLYTGDDLFSVRPLALARAFLHRYLRSVNAGRVLPQLWSADDEERDVVGPIDDADALAWAERSHCFCLEDGAPPRLYHHGPQTYERDSSSTCGKKSAYRMTLKLPAPAYQGDTVAAHDKVIARFDCATEPALQVRVAQALAAKGASLNAGGKRAQAITVYDELVVRFDGATEPALREVVAWAFFSKACVLSTDGKDAEEIAAYEGLIMRFNGATEPALRQLVAWALFSRGCVFGIAGKNAEAIAAYEDVVVRIGTETERVLHELVARALLCKARVLGVDARNAEAIATYHDLIARFGQASEAEIVRHVELARNELAILSPPAAPAG